MRDNDHVENDDNNDNSDNNNNKDDKDIKLMFNVLMYHLIYQCDTKLEKQKNEFQRTVTMADGMDDIVGALGTGNETTEGTIDEGAV